uniref:AB hydrolase-1 domain-containing protein n=1 Tax=Aegilops tauschii subsp. strangulata TaxID=200361 RepID=A0A452ZQ74_AEGTS
MCIASLFSSVLLTPCFTNGRHDIIAQVCHARRLAQRLLPVARMVDLHGAHLVSHERPQEVNNALMDLIKATKSATAPHEWSSQPENTSGMLKNRLLNVAKFYGRLCWKAHLLR